MRTIAFAALLLAFGVAPEALNDSRSELSDSTERSFAPGGLVRLDLSAGDYRISRGEDRRIRVMWHARTAEQMEQARVRLEVHGTEAEVTTWGPRRDNSRFRVEVELPGRSDLHLRMSAGDLVIAGIEGHKDVRLRAGDLTIEVPQPAQYGRVNASVTAGDISAEPFGVSTGGLFRSFSHTGPGRYELRARLWAGDLTFASARAATR